MTTNDIDAIRRAAQQMRKLAQNATPGADPLPGGWGGFGANTDRQGAAALFAGPAENGYRTGTVFSFDENCEACTPPSDADVQHITGWHPAVALAVADWLDAHATDLASAGGDRLRTDSPGDLDMALRVARAYLGPITTEATANTDDQPCCHYRCQDNTTGVTNQPTEPQYLIWSNHHHYWFAANGCGYRSNPADAGRYTLADAQKWLGRGCDCCRVPEVLVRADAVIGGGDQQMRAAIAEATKAAIEAGQINQHYEPVEATA